MGEHPDAVVAQLRRDALVAHGRALDDQMRKRHGAGPPPLHLALKMARCVAYIIAGQHIAPTDGPLPPGTIGGRERG